MTPSSPISAEPTPRHVALVGAMGAGKSEVGRRLARRLGRPFVDIDELVESGAGLSIAELFERDGEEGFRARESDALAAALSSALSSAVESPPAVVATGGGAVLDARSRRLLRERALVVWLRVTPDAAAARIGPDASRPLLVGGARQALTRLIAEREPLYRQVSHEVVETDGADIDQIVDDLVDLLNPMGSGRAEP
jgi:shikimate kinase